MKKEPKNQGLHSSGYKFAARSGNLGKTRFAQTAEISFRSAWNLLYAASVRPIQLIMDNG
ncbi:hypothetical protein B5F77_01805 [Parabacteroides sp. An277]|nr:hypothetical protein B5F77_01805 [Parabacteroides sp. An277]